MRRLEKKPETIVHKDHSVIIPPTTLRDRAMSIGAGSKDGFDTSALERAEEALAELASDFSTWMRDEATKLEAFAVRRTRNTVSRCFTAPPTTFAARERHSVIRSQAKSPTVFAISSMAQTILKVR
jgi:hypothetical protein